MDMNVNVLASAVYKKQPVVSDYSAISELSGLRYDKVLVKLIVGVFALL